MAYDGYRGQSTDDQSQYHSYHDHRDSVHYNGTDPGSARPISRASSRGGKSDISSQPQPIYDAANAVNYAFERSDAASHVDPKLIAQITEQVKKQVIDSLKSSGITAQHTAPSSNHSPSDSYPPRNVYTPPSPTRHTFSCDGSNASESPRQRSGFDAHDDNSTPRFERVERTMSTTSSHASTEQSRRERPVTAQRVPTDGEATTVEKIWKPLFDDSNKPTPRLGQFLRGLAIHLIDDYEPKKSLVVTPDKMLRFYDETAVADEVFPWTKIFNGTSNATLSKIYRDLRCQHHLVQEAGQHNSNPQTPALTPSGFEKWMETIIMAYPEVEFERLAQAVRDMPISNADDSKERFPKELIRRQFPQNGSLHAQQMTCASLSCGGKVPPLKSTSFPPPPPLQTQAQPNLERQRSPYSGTPDANASASEDEAPAPTSIPIERERKPYTAREGTGKFYEDNSGTRGSRSQSSASQTSGTSTARSAGTDYTQTNTRHSRANSSTTSRRGRSPSFSTGVTYGTRSDGSISDIPSSHYASNLHDYDERYRDTDTRRGDYTRRQTEADLGTSYPPGPRSVYDDEYNRSRSMSSGYAAGYGSSYGSAYAQTPTRY